MSACVLQFMLSVKDDTIVHRITHHCMFDCF